MRENNKKNKSDDERRKQQADGLSATKTHTFSSYALCTKHAGDKKIDF